MIFAVWAAAALPMAALAWLVPPALEDEFGGEGNVPMAKALLVCLTGGLIWQFVLVVVLVGLEQRTLRRSTLREALWLRSPRSPRSGRRGGRVWLILIPLFVLFAAEGCSRSFRNRTTAILPSFSTRTPVRAS
jgi:CAAX protease family protein